MPDTSTFRGPSTVFRVARFAGPLVGPVRELHLLRDEATLKSRRFVKELGYDLDCGMGLAQGHATLGAIGFEGRWDYEAIGTVSKLAARLFGEAKPGRIPISHRSLKTVDDLVKAEGVGELSLRVTQCLANAKNKGFRRRKSGIP